MAEYNAEIELHHMSTTSSEMLEDHLEQHPLMQPDEVLEHLNLREEVNVGRVDRPAHPERHSREMDTGDGSLWGSVDGHGNARYGDDVGAEGRQAIKKEGLFHLKHEFELNPNLESARVRPAGLPNRHIVDLTAEKSIEYVCEYKRVDTSESIYSFRKLNEALDSDADTIENFEDGNWMGPDSFDEHDRDSVVGDVPVPDFEMDQAEFEHIADLPNYAVVIVADAGTQTVGVRAAEGMATH